VKKFETSNITATMEKEGFKSSFICLFHPVFVDGWSRLDCSSLLFIQFKVKLMMHH